MTLTKVKLLSHVEIIKEYITNITKDITNEKNPLIKEQLERKKRQL